MDTQAMLDRRKRLLQYTEESIRTWNWPLVESGDITVEDLDEEVKSRTGTLEGMPIDMIAACLLSGLPDEMFYEA